MEKYDFIIQIIGGEKTGKTALAHAIADILVNRGLKIAHCDHPKETDWSEIKGKNVLMTEFRAVDDPMVNNSQSTTNKSNETYDTPETVKNKMETAVSAVEAFVKVFGPEE